MARTLEEDSYVTDEEPEVTSNEEEQDSDELYEDDENENAIEDTGEEEVLPDSANPDDFTPPDDMPSAEDIDKMSDDEFKQFLDTGKFESKKKASKPEPKQEEPEEEQEVEEKPVSKKIEDNEIDYKAAYESIFKPFKANGKEIQPRTVNDVVSLMQMGANYTKKMQQLAPMKRAVESLNKAHISEEDLNFLIDIHNGNQGAIKKLLKQHEVDPMDLDLDETNYVPNNNLVSDSDMEFNDVLQEIGEDNLPKIQEIVTKKWDAASKKVLLNNPDILRKLGEEVQLGRFDTIQDILEEQRMYGRYKGVSDLDAYSDIVTKYVDYMNQVNQQQQPKQQRTQSRTVQPRQTKSIPDKSKAAPSRAKPKTRSAKYTPNDILNMSDEDFNKLNLNDLYR